MSLRTQAALAEMPVMDLVRIDGKPQAMVAVYEWVMPLSYFVVIAFWLFTGGKLYHKNLNRDHMDQVLRHINGSSLFIKAGGNQSFLAYIAYRVNLSMKKGNPMTSNQLYALMQHMLLEAERLGHSPRLD